MVLEEAEEEEAMVAAMEAPRALSETAGGERKRGEVTGDVTTRVAVDEGEYDAVDMEDDTDDDDDDERDDDVEGEDEPDNPDDPDLVDDDSGSGPEMTLAIDSWRVGSNLPSEAIRHSEHEQSLGADDADSAERREL